MCTFISLPLSLSLSLTLSHTLSLSLTLVSVHSKSPLPGPDDIVRLLLHWCSEQLRSKVAADVSVGLSALQVLLRKNEYRTAFFNDDGLNKLTNLLRSQTSGPANSQLLYQAIYAMWLLSYNKSLAEQFHTTSAITRIIDTIRQITKVKVIRVGIATLTVRPWLSKTPPRHRVARSNTCLSPPRPPEPARQRPQQPADDRSRLRTRAR